MLLYYSPIEDARTLRAFKQTTHSLLVVEDDQGLRSVVKMILEDAGFTVSTANDGLDAIKAMESARFDLIILDLMMPRMDGETFIRTIESNGSRGNLPIIILTAKQVDDVYTQNLHVNVIITKPFEMTDLLSKIQSFFQD